MSLKPVPRGLRCHNPLNIREPKGDKTQWLGERATDDDPAFEEFETMAHGIRAAAKVMLNYEARYGLNTIEGIVTRWAPPTENNTIAYINRVCLAMQRRPDSKLNLRDAETMKALIKGMARVELGADYLTDADLEKGVDMALFGS